MTWLRYDIAREVGGRVVDTRDDPQQFDVYGWQLDNSEPQDHAPLDEEAARALVARRSARIGIDALTTRFIDHALPFAGCEFAPLRAVAGNASA